MVKESNISPNKQKNIRSRNTEAGKQTADNGHKSSKWVDERHQHHATLKKVSDSGNAANKGQVKQRVTKR